MFQVFGVDNLFFGGLAHHGTAANAEIANEVTILFEGFELVFLIFPDSIFPGFDLLVAPFH